MEPPYTHDSLSEASRREVIEEFNRQLSLVESTGGLDKPHHALRAQFLIHELERRSQNRQNWTMVVCTIAITIMTAAILYLTCIMARHV